MNRYARFSLHITLVTLGAVALQLALSFRQSLHAEPTQGLFWETSTSGAAKVQRLRDTSNGVVCYVAKALDGEDYTYGGRSKHPSISCVKP